MASFLDLKGYGHLLLSGAAATLGVAVAAMMIALAIGMLAALARLSQKPALRALATGYGVIIRGIPELVLLLFLYYGGTMLLQSLAAAFGSTARIDINAFAAGSIVIGFVYGAYAAEIFRGAFLAIPKGQIDAARACGMSPFLLFRRIQLPQAWRFAIPGLGNLWLTLLKATSITSVIGLTELARQSDLIKSPTHKPFTVFLYAGLIYLAFTAISDLLRQHAERWAQTGVRRE